MNDQHSASTRTSAWAEPPPPLPLNDESLPAVALQLEAMNSQTRRIAQFYLAAAACHALLAWFGFDWIESDWRKTWGDRTFVHAAYLSMGFMLLPAFGKWLFALIAIAYCVLSSLFLLWPAYAFGASLKRTPIRIATYLSCAMPPAGTLVGLYAAWYLHRRK